MDTPPVLIDANTGVAVMTSSVDFVTQTLEVFTLSPFAITKSIPLTGQPYINNAAVVNGVVYLGTFDSKVLTVNLLPIR